jgi:hypothetical protein
MVCATRRVPGLPAIGLAVLGVIVLAVPACTDDTGTTASVETSPEAPATSAAAPVDPITGNPIDPCSLLTADEVGSALQVAVGQPQAGPQSNLPNPLGQRTCTWSTAESPPRSVAVSVVTTESASLGGASGGDYTAANLFEDTKPLAEGLEPIDGLGDEAFFGAVAGMQVSVLEGDVYLSVTVPFGTTEGDAAAVQALAPLAVGRLP